MGQRYIDFLETDIVLVQDALDHARSPMVRTALAKLVDSLNGSLWLETPAIGPAPKLALDVGRASTEYGETVDWF